MNGLRIVELADADLRSALDADLYVARPDAPTTVVIGDERGAAAVGKVEDVGDMIGQDLDALRLGVDILQLGMLHEVAGHQQADRAVAGDGRLQMNVECRRSLIPLEPIVLDPEIRSLLAGD